MAKPKKPINVFINRDNTVTIIHWDKVVKDISNVYTSIIAYYVYKTTNAASRDWTLVKKIISQDVLSEIDNFCIDFNPNECIYAVVAENASGISEYAAAYGISGANMQSINVDNYLYWDIGKWDEKLWA